MESHTLPGRIECRKYGEDGSMFRAQAFVSVICIGQGNPGYFIRFAERKLRLSGYGLIHLTEINLSDLAPVFNV